MPTCRRQNPTPAPCEKNVRFLPSGSGRFIRFRRLRLDSAKRYENPARKSACRNTDEFPVSVTAALMGRFVTPTENDWVLEIPPELGVRVPRSELPLMMWSQAPEITRAVR